MALVFRGSCINEHTFTHTNTHTDKHEKGLAVDDLADKAEATRNVPKRKRKSWARWMTPKKCMLRPSK